MDLYTKEPIYHRPYQGNSWIWLFLRTFGKCADWEILVADKGFRTKAITELLEQNKNVKYLLPLKRNTTLIREKNLRKLDPEN
nr:hypothetical protein [Mycoplasmopsis bovis]